MSEHDLVNILKSLQGRIQYLESNMQNKPSTEVAGRLHEGISDAVSPHGQVEGLKPSQRKTILSGYPKIESLVPTTDENGLATRGMPAAVKQLVTKDLVEDQRRNHDIIRVASHAFGELMDMGDTPLDQRIQRAGEALRVISMLASDNSQRASYRQLQLCLKHAGAENAESLLDRRPQSETMDFDDFNIFQQAHVDAITEFKRFAAGVAAAQKKPDGNRNKHRSQGYNSSYRGAKNDGSRQHGQRGRGAGRGHGRGGGSSRANPPPASGGAVPNGVASQNQ